ncbi:uncharacterized protein LOC134341456 isoform X2 [Mobula hypostoma]|uniref:uncharacterized protein LOC134341456 isoform X2 n=1 Tax=Mobula hypostoma TaxID=723540 RepID=UPI002FC2CBAD
MSGLPFAALLLCLCITAGESQQFTITVENSQINVPVGGDALFSVRPSSKVRSGDWSINGILVVRWIDQTGSIDNEYRSRAELFMTNGSLLLKSVNVRDSGEYRVNMVPVSGSQSSATITLRVSAKTDDNYTLGSGAIVGIVLGLLIVGLIGGVSGLLIARKIGGIKDIPQSKHDRSINSGRKSTPDTNTVNPSQIYENFMGIEQGTRDNADDGSSTYMGLVLEDRSVYSDLKR